MKHISFGFSLLLLYLTVIEAQYINSDSVIYSEDMYNELKEEYHRVDEPLQKITEENEDFAENLADVEEILVSHSVPPAEIETFEETAEKLSCEKPWFWNAFKCVWIDVQNKRITERTKRNGKVVAMIAGPPLGCIILACCLCVCMAVLVRSRVKKLSKQIDSLQKRYKPGSIVLPTGEVKRFPPTVEEEEALEKLLQTLVSIV